MKRICSIALALCLMLSALAAFTSCLHTCQFSTDWSKDATSHWHACTGKDCEEIADKENHVWNEGVITTAPTQEADGVKTFTCSVCGQTTTEAVAFTGLSEAEWLLMTKKEAFENVTYTQITLVKATGIEVTTTSSIAFTKDAVFMTTESAGQTDSQYIPGAEEANAGRSSILEHLKPLLKYNNYDYDKESKTYKLNKQITEPFEEQKISDATLTVENGKVAKIIYTFPITENGVAMNVSITLTFTDYGTTVVNDPA